MFGVSCAHPILTTSAGFIRGTPSLTPSFALCFHTHLICGGLPSAKKPSRENHHGCSVLVHFLCSTRTPNFCCAHPWRAISCYLIYYISLRRFTQRGPAQHEKPVDKPTHTLCFGLCSNPPSPLTLRASCARHLLPPYFLHVSTHN